jgi:hypothetical protein
MSIYHPDAVAYLRQAKVLLPTSDPAAACNDHITERPIWDTTSPRVPDLQDMSTCNALSLRATADPFQWTNVDPDCGMLNVTPTPANTVCKHHPLNYLVMEHGRGGGP